MGDTAFTPQAAARIRRIHSLSEKYNGKIHHAHSRKLLDLIRSHADEIQELWQEDDRHFLVETGDLIILCLELLVEYDTSMDDILQECFKRYEKKLTGLLAGAESGS